MKVDLVSTLQEPKDVLAWNIFRNASVDRIGSSGLGLPATMTIRRASTVEAGCGQGADSIVLRRKHNFPVDWKAWYWFPPGDFWDFWGGCQVTLTWIADNVGGPWGDETPPIQYPFVGGLTDGTVIVDIAGNFSMVYGGCGFPCSEGWLAGLGLDPTAAISGKSPAAIPADFTLLREWLTPQVYVAFGGTLFHVTDPPTMDALGFDWKRVNDVPHLDRTRFPAVPIDGTLLRELHDPHVFLAESGVLHWINSSAAMDGRCLAWRHVRIVPDGALTNLPRGSPLGPP